MTMVRWLAGVAAALAIGSGAMIAFNVERDAPGSARTSAAPAPRAGVSRAVRDDAAVIEPDLEPPSRDAWGARLDDVVAAARRLAGSGASTKRVAAAATVLVSRMRSGPHHPGAWAPYLDEGVYQCNNRAWLLASVMREIDPECRLRRVGMASIPRQGAHSALEVYLPEQESWGYFDPSTGVYFTADGTIDGRVLSMAEIFAAPALFDDPGPIAPRGERADVPPFALDLGDDLAAVVAADPGFAPSNFPLRAILEEAKAYGAYLPDHPLVNPVALDAVTAPRIDGIEVDADGTVRNVLRAHRGADGRHLSWLDQVGITGTGLNVTPCYTITGLDPWARYELVLTFTMVRRGFALRPLAVRGARFMSRTPSAEPVAGGHAPLQVYRLPFVATEGTAEILMLHDGAKSGDRARVGRIEVVRVGPA